MSTQSMAPRRRPRLSVLVICCDEADRIRACLESVAGWADEIVVFDSGSRDGTVDIARRYADKLVVTDWPGYGPQRNRALQQCSGEWVFSLDADEVVSPELRAEIDATLSDPNLRCTMLKMPWRTWVFGKPLRHGRYTSPQGKLFLRAGARYRDHQVHESLIMPKRVDGYLRAPLDHYSWRDYEHLQQKHLKYGCLLAEQKNQAGKRGGLGIASLRFFTDFAQQYFLRLSVLDGWRGFLISVVLAQYAFHKYAALYTLQHDTARASTPTLASRIATMRD